MKRILAVLLLSCAATLTAQLPPVFPPDLSNEVQHDRRVRSYLPPTRIVWMQNDDLITGQENLLRPGDGQATTARVPYCVLESRAGKRPSVLLDFGREIQGGIQIVTGITEPKGPVKVRVRLGESVSEAMSEIGEESGATNDHALRDFTLEVPWLGVAEIGNSGFRFARIDLAEDDRTLPIKEVRAIFTYHDIPYLGSFRSSDPRLDSIWLTGAYTVHLNMQEHLWDGIKRDRLVWQGDLHPELRTALAVFGDHDVLRRSLDLGRDQTPLPGWMNGIAAYSLWWIIGHRDYYLWHGDRAYLQEQHDYLRALCARLTAAVDADGREHLGGDRFLDWPTSENPAAKEAGLHALMVLAMDAAAQLAAALNDPPLAAECRGTAEKMRGATPDYAVSKQSAALNALAGVVTPQAGAAVVKKNDLENFTTFYGYYMLQALALAGEHAAAVDCIDRFWGAMIDLGATTFWEDFDIRWADNAGRIDELTPAGKIDLHRTYGNYCYRGLRHSFCHGWASGPTAWASEHVLGISIVEPGCRTVRIRPNLGGLDWAEGTFPTPHGVIRVRHDRQPDGSVRSKIDAPKGVKIIR